MTDKQTETIVKLVVAAMMCGMGVYYMHLTGGGNGAMWMILGLFLLGAF